ncbi:MmgE/PrpD family protein [Arthrobacter sp. StoSoilB5]|uniref:MmgE/PrpD family protein n=1 Tax=Arthrobacter sp. StoSoilB5 TaxID=2830992 RepID=UPI001CC3FD0C|nr:MmgE/PrpD family protein [Arthrobacter sp. StoSoilB5]BCW44703.1 hypothetical protein StoSoilB5_18870 [Arthrobacter sp. StoSoilB5]
MTDLQSEHTEAQQWPSQTLEIASWIIHASSRDADPDAYASAQVSVTDFLGCAVSGSETTEAKLIGDTVCSPGRVPALGQSGLKLHPASAAYLHAWQAHAYEMDDGDWDTWGHLGSPTIAAALSAGWHSSATLSDLTDAVSIAFSFGMALGRAINPVHYARGFCTTGTIGTLTAAAAASRLLGLNEVSTAHALDFAVAQASGVRQFAVSGSSSCLIIPANAARTGFEAAILAANGLLGGRYAIEGELGFLQVFGNQVSGLSVPAEPGHHVPRIYFKPHSCCGNAIGPIHTFAEAWRSLGKTELERIHFELPKEVARNVDHQTPRSELEQHLSLQLAVAMHLTNGGIGARDLINLHITDDVRKTMGTVEISVLSSDQGEGLIEGNIGYVSLCATDGRSIRRTVSALGPQIGQTEITKKFEELVEPSLGSSGTAGILALLSNDSTSIRDLLQAGHGPRSLTS